MILISPPFIFNLIFFFLFNQNIFKGVISGVGPQKARHQSHPDEVPVFKGKGNKGNFEPATYGGGSGPGEDGKAHKLRVEQRDEEERLKGVYGFNQLVSDEIRQDDCCL